MLHADWLGHVEQRVADLLMADALRILEGDLVSNNCWHYRWLGWGGVHSVEPLHE